MEFHILASTEELDDPLPSNKLLVGPVHRLTTQHAWLIPLKFTLPLGESIGICSLSMLDIGRAAIADKDYIRAFEIYISLATSGDIEAQAEVGAMYQVGLGVEADFSKAEYWLMRASEGGRADAAHNLGTLYSMGSPEHPPDKKKALQWYLRGRDLGANIAPSEWYEAMELDLRYLEDSKPSSGSKDN